MTSSPGVGEKNSPVSTAGHPKVVTAFSPLVTPGPSQIGVKPWLRPWLARPMNTTGELSRTTAPTPLFFSSCTTDSCSGSAADLLMRVSKAIVIPAPSAAALIASRASSNDGVSETTRPISVMLWACS